jgi:hypothetical protein
LTTEKGPANAAADAVVIRGVFTIDEFPSCLCHF